MSDQQIPWTAPSDEYDELWVNDPNTRPEFAPDMLATMFAAQKETMARLWQREIENGSVPVHPSQFGELDERNVQGRLHEGYGYIVRELSEAMQLLRNKPWKQTLSEVDQDDFREEIADTFHFFLEFCIIAGIDAETLFRQYFAKNLIVHERAEGTY